MNLTTLQRLHLIHYGSPAFDPDIMHPVEDRGLPYGFNKPSGGLWTSPIDSEWGWKDWCIGEDFHVGNLKRSFEVIFEGNVLVIDGVNDLKKLKWVSDKTLNFPRFSPIFKPLVGMGVDAIHLTARGQGETRDMMLSRNLYGWDCETVFVMNPKCLTVVDKQDESVIYALSSYSV